MKILVTGVAGFIGMHVAERLLARGDEVIGIDNLNPYYDVDLKRARLARLTGTGFTFIETDLADREAMAEVFAEHQPQRVVHLGAQAGVRWSIDHPYDYADSNILGLMTVLEGCRHQEVEHLVMASSSSVYGLNRSWPYNVHQSVDHAVSLYAATKKAGEVMAHSYAHLYRIPTTCLRFFTVYGPWGRPDMAYWTFTRRILDGEPIQLFNHGHNRRDFTYIDDIVEGVLRVLDQPAVANPAWSAERPDPATSSAPWRVFNIGNDDCVSLERFVAAIESATGRAARTELLPAQPGDVETTHADISAVRDAVGYRPTTTIEEGMRGFVEWFQAWRGRT